MGEMYEIKVLLSRKKLHAGITDGLTRNLKIARPALTVRADEQQDDLGHFARIGIFAVCFKKIRDQPRRWAPRTSAKAGMFRLRSDSD